LTSRTSIGRLALVLALLVAGSARAADETDPRTCTSDLRAAVEGLGLGVRAEALRCPAPGMVILRLSPAGASPLDVEVWAGAEAAFRTVDGVGLSPILEVDDWGTVPEPQRAAFDALVGAVGRGELSIAGVTGVMPAALRGHRVPWLLAIAALAVAAAAWTRRRRARQPVPAPSPSGLQWPAAGQDPDPALPGAGWWLFCGALLLRAIGGVWGVWHVNGHGPGWLLRAWQGADPMPGYGPGYPELFSGPVWLLPTAPDVAVFAANLLLGAALAPLIYRLGRSLGLSWGPALLVGLLVAIDPLSLRFAASEAYHPALLLGRHGAELLLVTAAARLVDGRRLEGLLVGLAGALVAAQTARIHPVAWPTLALAPLVLLAVRRGEQDRGGAGLVATAVGAVALALVLLVTAGPSGVERVLASGPVSSGDGPAGWLNGLTPRLLVWTAFGAVVLSLRGGPARRLAAAAVASILLLGATRLAFVQTGYWQASYLRLHLGLPLLALAAALPADPLERLLKTRVVVAALVAIGLACALTARGAPPTTEQAEHRWLRGALSSQAEGCELRWLEQAGKRNLQVAWHLVPGAPVPMRVRSADDVRAGLLPGTCRLYLRSSLCAAVETRRHCDEIERGLELEELGRVELPALPSYDDHPYDGAPVPVVLFRVR